MVSKPKAPVKKFDHAIRIDIRKRIASTGGLLEPNQLLSAKLHLAVQSDSELAQVRSKPPTLDHTSSCLPPANWCLASGTTQWEGALKATAFRHTVMVETFQASAGVRPLRAAGWPAAAVAHRLSAGAPCLGMGLGMGLGLLMCCDITGHTCRVLQGERVLPSQLLGGLAAADGSKFPFAPLLRSAHSLLPTIFHHGRPLLLHPVCIASARSNHFQ